MSDGTVVGSDKLPQSNYLTIPNTDRSAFFATLHKVYQDTVNLSDSVKFQRAAVQNTIDVMRPIDAALAAIGNDFVSRTVQDPDFPNDPAKRISKDFWEAEADSTTDMYTEAYDVAYGLALSGQAPIVVTLAYDDVLGRAVPSTDITSLAAHFYYDANQGSNLPPDWVEFIGTPGDDVIPTWDVSSNGLSVMWKYERDGRQYDIRAFNPDDIVIKEFASVDELTSEKLATYVPGILLHKTGTDEYYLLTAGRDLVAVPDPTASTFFACPMQVEKDTALQWKDKLKAGHEQMATVSQTQSEYVSALASNLQNHLSLLTNLFKTLERTLTSQVDRI